MRRFALRNNWGDTWDLTDAGRSFFHNLGGLGLAYDNEYLDIDNGFFAAPKRCIVQPQIVGTICFARDAYRYYRELIDWVMASDTLTLIYDANGTEYCIDVDIDNVDKGELAQMGWLESPITFVGLSPWYRATPIALIIPVEVPERGVLGYTTYPFRYGAQYPISWSYTVNTITVTPEGHLPAGISLQYTGVLSSPKLELLLGGAEIGCLSLPDITTAETDTLVFSTAPHDTGVWLIDKSGNRQDMCDSVDITRNTYFRLPRGVSSILRFTSKERIFNPVRINLYQYYRSV